MLQIESPMPVLPRLINFGRVAHYFYVNEAYARHVIGRHLFFIEIINDKPTHPALHV
jgi:hypothetical protein